MTSQPWSPKDLGVPPSYRTVTDPITGEVTLWHGRTRICLLQPEYADLAATLALAASEVGCIASVPDPRTNGMCGVPRKAGPFCGFHAPMCLWHRSSGEVCGSRAEPGRLTCQPHEGLEQLQPDTPAWARLRQQAREWLKEHRIASPQSGG